MKNRIKEKVYNALRKSEKYTKTDMVYLAKGGSWLTFGSVVASGFSLITALVFANFLPKSIYGTYSFVLSMVAILAIPTLAGMKSSLIRAVAQGYDATIFKALRARLNWGTLSVLGSLAVSIYYFVNHNSLLGTSFLIVAALMPIMESYQLYNAFLVGKKKFDTKTKYGIGARIFSVIPLIIAATLTNSVTILLLAYFVPHVISRIFLFKLTTKKFIENKKEDPSAIGYGKHLSLVSVIGIIANHIDKIIIFHFLGAAQVAIYAFSLAPVDMLGNLVSPITTLAMPKLAEKKESETKKTIFSKIWKLAAVTAIPVIAYIILAPWLFSILFPQYLESVLLSQILAISLVVSSGLGGTYLNAHRKIKESYSLMTFYSVIKIILTLALTVTMGLMGTILSVVISRFAEFFFSLWLIKNTKETSLSN